MTTPADQEQRDHIRNDLDSNIVVEAAAGTGKTTSMVGRMVALLLEDKCKISTIAAVTFTKKSASELRERFHAGLMSRARSTEVSESKRGLLRNAVENIEQCFIGTIHSFCGRILRERPIEAGVRVAFEEIDEVADQRLQEEAWDMFVAEAYTKQDSVLDELTDVGLTIGQLGDAFKKFVLYPDVETWPSEKPKSIPFMAIADAVNAYVNHIREIEYMLPVNPGSDKLSVEYRKLERAVRQRDLSNPLVLMEILEGCKYSNKMLTQKPWGDYKQNSKDERDRWEDFYASTIKPALSQWREIRYEIIIRVLQSATDVYDKMRIGRGLLNFQDLLMKASEVLRDSPHVRAYFKKRFTHLLIDEFQDTDPVQAKLMMYLTATDESETQWDRCMPRPGSLFVVGDPKQSIYRFRRADIVTYNRVKEIIEQSGGKILTLSANFRTSPEILKWVNDEFTERFPESATNHAPGYVPFDYGRQDGTKGDFHGVQRLDIPEDYSKKPYLSLGYEADAITNTIAVALEKGMTVSHSAHDEAKGAKPQVQPGDFLIVTRGKKNMNEYAKRLGALGIPHEVTGGTVLNETREIALLCTLLYSVVHADDPVALVNLLRGELFGFSDRLLFRFRQSNGCFKYTSQVQEELTTEDTERFTNAFSRLKQYATWLRHLPHVSALERIVQDSGLLALAASKESGNIRAGSLEKVIEIVRAEQSQIHDVTGLVELIRKLSEGELDHDGMIAGQAPESVVRIMNLHKVKGLEASIVFLADTKGEKKHEVSLHVDRSEASLTRGFMSIRGESGTFTSGPLLAHPHDWELAQETEEPFQNAETTRLLYVAATRAGSNLVVSSLVGSNRGHFWHTFDEALRAQSPLRQPETASALIQETVDSNINEYSNSIETQSQALNALSTPTYARGGAKDIALSDSIAPKAASHGEHGTEWGSLLHNLFESAMKHPDHDIRPLAIAQLNELGLPQSRLDEALDTVTTVMQSDIWKRAQANDHVLTEVPFQYAQTTTDEFGKQTPIIRRGIIDLSFKEQDGWVIVDYKTDQSAMENLDQMIEYYTPQLKAYAEAWEQCTGEFVKESGLYFSTVNRYLRTIE